jgi:hypothetical protein
MSEPPDSQPLVPARTSNRLRSRAASTAEKPPAVTNGGQKAINATGNVGRDKEEGKLEALEDRRVNSPSISSSSKEGWKTEGND